MNFTPDNFLLVILLAGLFVLVMSALVYTYGWAWCKRVSQPPEVEIAENYEPKKMGRRGSMNIQATSQLPSKGPGFYTSPAFTPSTPATVAQMPTMTAAADHTMIAFDQPVPPPEWIGGYMLGLSSSAIASDIVADSSFYLDNLLYTLTTSSGTLQHHYYEPDGTARKDPNYYDDIGHAYHCGEVGETCDAYDSHMNYMDFSSDGGVIAGLF